MIERLDEDSKKRFLGMAGWGLVGAYALGPLGAIGGMMFGGNKKQVTFLVEFRDGCKIMARTDSKTYVRIMGYNI